MIRQSKAKIFLQEDRGHHEDGTFRTCNHFNFGNDIRIHKTAFGSLYILNDDTLAASRSIQMRASTDSILLLVPVVGSVQYLDNHKRGTMIHPQQGMLRYMQKGETCWFVNTHKDGMINYIQSWFCLPENAWNRWSGVFDFDFAPMKNQWIDLIPHGKMPVDAGIGASIGKFDARKENRYRVRHAGGGCFLFVIEGVIEAEGRLLHPRDGLALWELEEIELEALSHDAIILLLEILL
jgi:quercetin 2,3-dioxygenase